MKWQETMHANETHGRQWVEADPLALKLIELAVNAGWKPRDCIEFAQEAHKFVTSTVSAAGALQTVACAKDIAVDLSEPGKSMPDSALALHRLEWGPHPETRRNALQALADQNRTMREAAEILGIKPSLAFYAARRLKVSFHGPRGRKLQPAARDLNGAAKPKKRTAMHAPVNGEPVADLAGSPRIQRRCLSCNRIFEPAEIRHSFCNACDYASTGQS
jgi:hypothetical protein